MKSNARLTDALDLVAIRLRAANQRRLWRWRRMLAASPCGRRLGGVASLVETNVSVIPAPRHGVGDFARWVASSCTPNARVLNIGAGRNLSGPLKPLTGVDLYLVGVDPDSSIHENVSLDERHQMSMEDFARANPAKFDVAFAVYVLEHVANPQAFIAACAEVLKPGGSLFGLTLNVRQYFGSLTWVTSRLGLSDGLLEKLKSRDVVEAYHFPTEYRLNSIPTLTNELSRAGFCSVEFRCYDHTARYQWYLPRGSKWIASLNTRVAYALGSPNLMGHLTFRATI